MIKKCRLYLFIFFLSGILTQFLYCEIYVVNDFSLFHRDVRGITSDNLVLIDLDNCLIESKSSYGHLFWFDDILEKMLAEGIALDEAVQLTYPRWNDSQMHIEVFLRDEQAALQIRSLQEKGIEVVAYTHRHPSILEATLKQLQSVGVDFKESSPCVESFYLEMSQSPLFHSGILFIHDANEKGEVLSAFLKKINRKPKKLIFIDDTLRHIKSVEGAAKSLDIEFIGYHFTYQAKEGYEYNSALAAIEEGKVNL